MHTPHSVVSRVRPAARGREPPTGAGDRPPGDAEGASSLAERTRDADRFFDDVRRILGTPQARPRRRLCARVPRRGALCPDRLGRPLRRGRPLLAAGRPRWPLRPPPPHAEGRRGPPSGTPRRRARPPRHLGRRRGPRRLAHRRAASDGTNQHTRRPPPRRVSDAEDDRPRPGTYDRPGGQPAAAPGATT